MSTELVTEPDAYEMRVAAKEEKLGFKICGARNRELNPCANPAGKGTDHLGEGRCRLHGGRNQSPLSKSWRHGKNSKIKTTHPILREKMEELAVDHQVFDLEEEILKMRAITEFLAEQSEWQAVSKNIVDLSKVVERLHNIQVGRRYVISIENVSTIIETVKDVIFRFVPDEYTRHLIATELSNLRVSAGAPAKYIEGEVVEQ